MDRTPMGALYEEIMIPQKMKPIEDKSSGAKSIFFPITYPDNTNGFIVLGRTKSKTQFVPSNLIKRIIIEYNEI